jgi:hypothetical protein
MTGVGRKYAFSWQNWLGWVDLAVDSLEVGGLSFYNLFRFSVHSAIAAEVDQDTNQS